MNKNQLQPILFGGLFIGVLSALPVVSMANLCCCLWIIGGGGLTAWLLQRERAEPISLSEGALGGFLAGIVGAVVYVVVSIPIGIVTAPFQRRMMELVMESQGDIPPEVREMMDNFGAEGVIAGAALGFVMYLIGGMIFSALGGLIGAMLCRPSSPQGPPASSRTPPPQSWTPPPSPGPPSPPSPLKSGPPPPREAPSASPPPPPPEPDA